MRLGEVDACRMRLGEVDACILSSEMLSPDSWPGLRVVVQSELRERQ